MNFRFSNTAERIESRAFFIPAGAQKFICKISGAVAYFYGDSGKPCAMGFQKSAARPAFRFSFRDEKRRETYVAEWFRGLADRARRIAERKAVRKAFAHTLETGDILYNTWGYDQTNVDFYQVTGVFGKSVDIRAIAAAVVETHAQGMSGTCVPVRDSFKGEPKRKLVREGNCAGDACPWHGRPIGWSSYA